MEINKEFVKLVAENPELPIKVFINGECGDGDCWHCYTREEQNSEISKIVTALEKLSLKE